MMLMQQWEGYTPCMRPHLVPCLAVAVWRPCRQAPPCNGYTSRMHRAHVFSTDAPPDCDAGNQTAMHAMRKSVNSQGCLCPKTPAAPQKKEGLHY